MNAMPPESVDAIITDPPYGLSFMSAKWDATPPGVQWAEACYRVLKPGGHIAAFGGTRTWHRLAVAIEDAGFEMRDSLAWLYGSGFPKSMNVGKAIDKAREDSSEWRAIGQALRSSREAAGYRTRRAFAPLILDGHKNLESAAANLSNWENGLSFPTWERWESLKAILSLPDDMDAEVLRLNGRKGEWGDERPDRVVSGPGGNAVFQPSRRVEDAGTPATPEAEQWDGWGTALKPAFEPIVLARKPLAEKTVARNVLAHGTGAINVDACRIEGEANRPMPRAPQGGILRLHGCHTEAELRALAEAGEKTPDGRDARATLARTIADRERYESSGEKVTNTGRWPANVLLDEHAAAWVDEQSGHQKDGVAVHRNGGGRQIGSGLIYSGSKNPGPAPDIGYGGSGGASRFFYTAKAPKSERPNVDGVQHPTVKPLAIMRWLIRLVTPPGGTVLDPFAGSGTTIEAALIEGFDPVGIEMETDYLPLIQHRIDRQAGTLTA